MNAPPPPSWTKLLTLSNLVPAFGRETVLEALQHRLEYRKAPTAAEGANVTAIFRTSPSDPAWLLGHPVRHSGIEVRVNFVTAGDEQMRIVASCTCNRVGSRCGHISALMVDLALQPALLEAVLQKTPDEQAVAALPNLRAQALAELRAQFAAADWFSLPAGRSARPWEIRLVFNDWRPGASSARKDQADVPTVELRLGDPETKTLLDPREVLSKALPMLERRTFTLGRPLPRGRKGVELQGTNASVALKLLCDSGRPVLLGEKGRDAVVFATELATVRLVRAAVPDPAGAQAQSAKSGVCLIEGRWRTHGDDALDVAAGQATVFTGPYPFLWVESLRTLYPIDPAVDLDVAWALHCKPEQEVSVQHLATVYRGLQRVLAGRSIALPPPETMGLTARSEAVLSLRIEGAPLKVKARLEASYEFGDIEVGPVGALSSVPIEHEMRRDLERELAVSARVLAAGLAWDDEHGCFVAEQHAAAEFWAKGITALRAPHAQKLNLYIAEGLRRVVVRPPVKASVRVSMSGGGMFETEFAFDVGELATDIEVVREALRAKRRWLTLDDGSISEIQDTVASVVEELAELASKKATRPTKDGRVAVSLPAHQLGRVERWLDAGIGGEVTPAVEHFRSRLRVLAVKAEPAMPAGLNATLRPYQLQGVAWLQFLSELGAGGLLADDMGLGKTLTTLALLLWSKERLGAAPSLVVCPTSVAPNWVREAARFAPALSVSLYHGLARERDADALRGADIVVTTYALLRRDAALLASIEFRYAILDEAQNIKNAGAQTSQAARELVAQHRLALSGTPVENHLGELWSIMDFCNPGMLGTPKDFMVRYERPIASDATGAAAQRLRGMVRPFLLRRTKREVLKELPPKVEIDQLCTPTSAQRKLYDALSVTALAEVERRIAEVGMARAGLNVLTALLRLRQMACDPRLVDPTQPASASAKRSDFLALIRSLVEEGRRALVFSQFVGLLSLWRTDLDAMGVGYEYLDGSTHDRDAAVQRFQKGAAPLFLISLKAGGTGLTLTGADTVIHCDPWWNPAVEDQATDRAHRFGQTRSVTVYRLLTRGTVEERILSLKSRKRDLASAVIAEDAGALHGISEDDVRALLGRSDADQDFEGDDPGGSDGTAR